MTLRDPTLSRADLRIHLRILEAERRTALATALASDSHYMEDLADEIDATHRVYIAASVLELAHSRTGWQVMPQA